MKTGKIILTAILFAAVMLLLSACGTTDIDVSQYINVTFDGLDGKGTAYLTYSGLDDAIETAILGDDKTFEKAFEKYDVISAVEDSVSIALDTDEGLSNGDIVTVNIGVDNETAKKNGVKFTGTDPIHITVADLQEITEIDPFDSKVFNITSGEGIYIDFTGISPKASIQIRNTLPESNPLHDVEYSVDRDIDENIKKGQQIKIIAEEPYDWEDYGYVLKSTETTVTCENVDEYITNADEIDDETMNKIIAQCKDLKTSKLNSKSSSIYPEYIDNEGDYISSSRVTSYDNVKFSKEYFFLLKDGLDIFSYDSMEENGLYLSFTVDLSQIKPLYSFSDKDKPYDVKNAVGYFYIHDIVKNKNGEIQFTSNMVKLGNYLYSDEDAFKIDVLNEYLDEFTMTEKASDKKFE